MKTLPKSITRDFFDSPDGYRKFDKYFKGLVNSRTKLGSGDYILAQVLRGRDWTTGCGQISNETKLHNGGIYNWGPFKALYDIKQTSALIKSGRAEMHSSLLEVGLTKEGYLKAVAMLPDVSPHLNGYKAVLEAVKNGEGYKVVIDCKEKETIPVPKQTFFGKLLGKIWG